MPVDIQGLPGVVTALQKGGVTKTSLGLNVAERIAAQDNEVVMIDLDHDCHLTSLLLDEETEQGVLNDDDAHIGKAMFGDVNPEDLLIETDFGIHLLPSTNLMGEVVDRMKNTTYGVNKLRHEVVVPLHEQGYDYFLIDPPGGEGQMLDAAFAAVQRTIIPITPEAGTVNGLARLLERTVQPLRNEFPVDIVAITPNRMQETISRDSSEQQIARDLNESFRDYLPEYAKVDLEVFETIDKPGERLMEIPKPGLRKRKSINDAFKNGQPVAQYDPECDQIEHFDTLASMVIESCKAEQEQGEVAVHG
ncbi:ParA family protein (plasmid) [Natrinema zhouii]|uniref:ParA family protein n=1 Tax=Natrinema zhouii TaxID=1710539 RepID=UPI001CFF9693|nr:ParA family protein [Natrinema zhouii]UHQ98188.1 ParA family protein [Natrinema zhouii]